MGFFHEFAGMVLAMWEMRNSSVRTSESSLLLAPSFCLPKENPNRLPIWVGALQL